MERAYRTKVEIRVRTPTRLFCVNKYRQINGLTMPKLYEYLGYIFLFYTNDHRPIHVHVQRGDKEMKVEIEDEQWNQHNNKGIFIVTFKKLKGCPVFDSKDK